MKQPEFLDDCEAQQPQIDLAGHGIIHRNAIEQDQNLIGVAPSDRNLALGGAGTGHNDINSRDMLEDFADGSGTTGFNIGTAESDDTGIAVEGCSFRLHNDLCELQNVRFQDQIHFGDKVLVYLNIILNSRAITDIGSLDIISSREQILDEKLSG